MRGRRLPDLMAAARAGRRAAAVVLLAAVAAGAARPSVADFADGLAAYDAGDMVAAFDEWKRLAEAGHVEAQVALAGLYETGALGEPQPNKAVEWYRRAAARGDATAQLNLGDHYDRGAGVPRDRVRAFAWFSLAAAQGRAWAQRRRDELERGLSAAELARAERLIARHRRGQ